MNGRIIQQNTESYLVHMVQFCLNVNQILYLHINGTSTTNNVEIVEYMCKLTATRLGLCYFTGDNSESI